MADPPALIATVKPWLDAYLGKLPGRALTG